MNKTLSLLALLGMAFLVSADYNCRRTCEARHEQCTSQCGHHRDEQCLARCPYRDEEACRALCPFQRNSQCITKCDRTFNDHCINSCRPSNDGRKNGGGFYIFIPVDYSEYVVDDCLKTCPMVQNMDCLRNCQNREDCTRRCYREPLPSCVFECKKKRETGCAGCRDSRCRANCGYGGSRCQSGRCF